MLLRFELFAIVLHEKKAFFSSNCKAVKTKINLKKINLGECLKLKLELSWPIGEYSQILPRSSFFCLFVVTAKDINPFVTGSSHSDKAASLEHAQNVA